MVSNTSRLGPNWVIADAIRAVTHVSWFSFQLQRCCNQEGPPQFAKLVQIGRLVLIRMIYGGYAELV